MGHMRGTFKQEFNKSAINGLAYYLKDRGISFSIEWMQGKKVISPGDNSEPNCAIFKINDKVFFSQMKKNELLFQSTLIRRKLKLCSRDLQNSGCIQNLISHWELFLLLFIAFCLW